MTKLVMMTLLKVVVAGEDAATVKSATATAIEACVPQAEGRLGS